jgi:hypothetical protein
VARQHKAEALPEGLGALYAEVRRMREARRVDRPRLEAIVEAARDFGGEPLLEGEVQELLAR